MQNVPKIVQARLQRQSPMEPESHPDADLLTAFAEQSLSGRERDGVVHHLARCGDCRQVVALALPASEVLDAATTALSTRTAWLRWPVLRWSVVAAGILAVLSVGVLQYRLRQEKSAAPSLLARSQAADIVEQNGMASSQKDVSPSALPAMSQQTEESKKSNARTEMALAKASSAATATATAPRPGFVRGAGAGTIGGSFSTTPASSFHGTVTSHGYTASAPAADKPISPATARQNSAVAGRQTLAAPPASQMVQVQAAATAVESQSAQNQTAQNQSKDELIESGRQASSDLSESVVRAKTPEQQTPVAGALNMRAESSLAKILPRWNISSTGALQRSLDGGKTWLDVSLAVDTSLNSNLRGRSQTESLKANARAQTKTVTAPEAVADAKGNAKSTAQPAAKSAYAGPTPYPPTIFRALSVSSNAAEVWAGGSAGSLYHTMDSGNLWVRVVPSYAGTVLTGDIIGIQSPDPDHVSVTTSNAEVWSTSDSGQSWVKQQ